METVWTEQNLTQGRPMSRSFSRVLLSPLTALAFAAGLSAQCPALGMSLGGATHVERGSMFDVVNVSAHPIRITGFDQFAYDSGTTVASLYTKTGSWTGSQLDPAAWTLVGSNPAWNHLSFGQTPLGIPTSVIIPPGATQGFYIAVPSASLILRIGGLGTSQAADGTIDIRTGVALSGLFGPIAPLSTDGHRWLGTVHYCKAATNTVIGAGCGGGFNSFYGDFADATIAQQVLTGNVLRLAPTANGYVGAWENGTASASFVPPSGASAVPVGDDSFFPFAPTTPLPTPYGSQSVLSISGNGIVAFGPFVDTPGAPPFTPTTTGFLQSSNGGVYAWHDYNVTEAGSGPILTHYAGNLLCVTFADVESYPVGLPNRSTLQFQFDLATGGIALVFVNIDGNPVSAFGSRHIVGVTAPGASMDPGAVDIAIATLVSVNPEGVPPSLAGLTAPVIGANWQLQTNDLPATTAFGITVIGLSDPGVDDLAVIGMPGCGLRAALDILSPFVLAPGTPTYPWSITIPANTPFGLPVFATTIVATNPATNAFGFITSNGVRGLVNGF